MARWKNYEHYKLCDMSFNPTKMAFLFSKILYLPWPTGNKKEWFLNDTKLNACLNSWDNSVQSPLNNHIFSNSTFRDVSSDFGYKFRFCTHVIWCTIRKCPRTTFIKNLPHCFRSATLYLYTDDTKCIKSFHNFTNINPVQYNTDCLFNWSCT